MGAAARSSGIPALVTSLEGKGRRAKHRAAAAKLAGAVVSGGATWAEALHGGVA